jgi:hypothetical protein
MGATKISIVVVRTRKGKAIERDEKTNAKEEDQMFIHGHSMT